MTRLIIGAAGAIGLILLVTFVASRLVRSRATGLSIRMQIFLALAGIVGAFGLSVGLLLLDRLEARDTAPAILIITTVLGVAAAAAAALIGRAIASPIEALTEFAVRVSEGERRAPPPPAPGREVQRLLRAIDSMRRELEGRPFVETFAADLSHELKNPVAAIRASAEVLADGALAEPVEAARFVARIQEATSRIEHMLGELLSLARIEARGVEEASVVDVAEIARQSVSTARERAGAASVELDVAGACSVRGDAVWLSRAVDNLVENAQTHGQRGSTVRVSVWRSQSDVLVAVRNEGAIRQHVAKRLFRRFVTTRADKGGTGLGLAIVRAVAEAHSGSAECVSSGPPAVEFRLTLPFAKGQMGVGDAFSMKPPQTDPRPPSQAPS